MFAPSVGTVKDGEHAFATSGGTAWRRRQRRLRAFRRFVLWHSKMEVAAALHHTSGRRTSTTPQFSSTAVEPIAPRVVVPLPHIGGFPGPVYDQVHQEQFTAGEMPENIVEFPVVREQVIVQAIPEVVDPLPPIEEFTGPVYNLLHQEQFAAGETPENLVEFPVVQEQVIVQAIPEVVDSLPPVQQFTGSGFFMFIMNILLQSLRSPSFSRCLMMRVTQRGVPGHPVWVSRGGHRIGSSCAPWSSSLTSCPWCRFWTFLSRREWTSWWRRAGTSICTSLSRLLKCP